MSNNATSKITSPFTLRELVKDFDDNFDYKNLIQFRDPDFLKKKYGDKLFKKFTDWFKDEWYTVLGDAIYDKGDVHHLMADTFRDMFEGEINFEDDDFSDYEPSVHEVTKAVNNCWTLGRQSFTIQEVK